MIHIIKPSARNMKSGDRLNIHDVFELGGLDLQSSPTDEQVIKICKELVHNDRFIDDGAILDQYLSIRLFNAGVKEDTNAMHVAAFMAILYTIPELNYQHDMKLVGTALGFYTSLKLAGLQGLKIPAVLMEHAGKMIGPGIMGLIIMELEPDIDEQADNVFDELAFIKRLSSRDGRKTQELNSILSNLDISPSKN